MNYDQEEMQEIKADFKRLEEEVVARETSTLRALVTLLSHWKQYKEGERDFPERAIIGLAGAYLTPRIIFIVGSLFAVGFTALQVVILGRQNELISNQNQLIQAQTKANSLEAIIGAVEDIDTLKYEPWKRSLLIEYAPNTFDTLLLLRTEKNVTGGNADYILTSALSRLTIDQQQEYKSVVLESLHYYLKGMNHNNSRFDRTVDFKGDNDVLTGRAVRYVAIHAPHYDYRKSNPIVQGELRYVKQNATWKTYVDYEIDILHAIKGRRAVKKRKSVANNYSIKEVLNENGDTIREILNSIALSIEHPNVYKILENKELWPKILDAYKASFDDGLVTLTPEDIGSLVKEGRWWIEAISRRLYEICGSEYKGEGISTVALDGAQISQYERYVYSLAFKRTSKYHNSVSHSSYYDHQQPLQDIDRFGTEAFDCI